MSGQCLTHVLHTHSHSVRGPGMRVCAAHVSLPTALLTTCASSRLSLESSALCVDSAARTPLLSVTPLSFSPSVGGM